MKLGYYVWIMAGTSEAYIQPAPYRTVETVNIAPHSPILLVYELQPPISGQGHIRHPPGGGVALVPQSITDQITDQYAPYCSELGDGVSNETRVLDVTWCRYREPTSVWGHQD